MQALFDHGAHGVRQVVETILGPWGGTAAVIEAYEAAVRSAADAQLSVARAVALQPIGSIVASLADLTRDIGAVQASTARWILDA